MLRHGCESSALSYSLGSTKHMHKAVKAVRPFEHIGEMAFVILRCFCSISSPLINRKGGVSLFEWSLSRPQFMHRLSSGKSMTLAAKLGDSREKHQNNGSANAFKEEENFRRELYPEIEPYSSGFLKVSDLHALYWEQSGNPDGHPVVFLHGGPGAGTVAGNRRFFDPHFFRIILFDQRGAGKSRPHACLEENATWDLIDDIEKLRKHTGIEEWQVFGGSWGSTLALAYAQSHAERVTGMVLRGIFLLRKKEIDWFYEGGASTIYPDAWEQFRDFIPEEERNNYVNAYYRRLHSSNPETQKAAAKIWTTWEMMTSYLLPNEEYMKKGEDDEFSLAFARIENHYFKNKGFFPIDSFLLDNVDKIRHIPTTIVQGRYDICCPMMSAWDLHKAWPEAKFKVVLDAGHSANEIGIAAELVAANDWLKGIIMAKV